MAQWVKDPKLPPLRYRSQRQLKFGPWTGHVHMPQVWSLKGRGGVTLLWDGETDSWGSHLLHGGLTTHVWGTWALAPALPESTFYHSSFCGWFLVSCRCGMSPFESHILCICHGLWKRIPCKFFFNTPKCGICNISYFKLLYWVQVLWLLPSTCHLSDEAWTYFDFECILMYILWWVHLTL